MNCPNCGAENEAEARFCAECGTPLDDVVVESAKVEQAFDETSEDISASGEAAAEAKTLAVDQASVVATTEEVDNAATVDDDASPSEPESSPPPSTPSSADEGGSDQNGGGMDFGGNSGSGGSNRTLIIVGVIVLVFLFLCCCCSVLVGAIIGSEPDLIEDLIEEIAVLPVYLAFV